MSFLVKPIVHTTPSQMCEEKTSNTSNPLSSPDKNKDLELGNTDDKIDYLARAQWLRAAVLGANDGLVSVASLMIGVGAVSSTAKAMLVSGLAGLVAGACSMAIGEFVSVYTQYDIETNLIEQGKANDDEGENKEPLANPLLAAGASALSFSIGGILPLLAGSFIHSWGVRLGVVLAVTSLALVSFGWIGARVGGAKPSKSALRVLIGGWMAMLLTFAILKVFGLVFHVKVSSSS